jgi:hypothetical protein
MEILKTCYWCRKAVGACVVCGLLAGPIAAGDYELAQDALGALADWVSNARSTASETDNFQPAMVQTVQSSGDVVIRVPAGKLTATGHAPTVVNSSA